MNLLNKIWKEYQDYTYSKKYFSQKKNERVAVEQKISPQETKKNDGTRARYFNKKLSSKGSTYSYGKQKYQPNLGLIR
jgi:hypothetical protein